MDLPRLLHANGVWGMNYNHSFIQSLSSINLRRALWFLRRQDTRPHETNPAAAQYDSLATSGSIRAEYRRRGLKIPKPTKDEQK